MLEALFSWAPWIFDNRWRVCLVRRYDGGTVLIWLLLAFLILIAVAVYAILNSTPDF